MPAKPCISTNSEILVLAIHLKKESVTECKYLVTRMLIAVLFIRVKN